jgi:TonB family protein
LISLNLFLIYQNRIIMKKSYLQTICFLIFINQFAIAQYFGPFNKSNDKYKTYYLHTLEPGEKIINTWYHYIVTYHKESERYILRLFHPEKQLLLSESRYLDKQLEIKDGLEKRLIYTTNCYAVGNYRNNKEEGNWKEVDSNNQIVANYKFVNGKREGKGSFFYSINKLQREDYYEKGKKTGNWIYFYENGHIQKEESYSDDKLDGANKFYDSTGTLDYTFNYLKGDVVSRIKATEDNNTELNYLENSDRNPYFVSNCYEISSEEERSNCGLKAMYNYLAQTIKYPTNAQRVDMSGKILVKFIIEKDGTIGEVKLLNALCESLENEALRVIKSMPKWSPGYQDGKPVRVYYTMPIIFKLD